MTPQMQTWLRQFIGAERYVYVAYHDSVVGWCVEMWECDRDDYVAIGYGPTPDGAEISALEDYAARIFVPGPALEQGRRVLGLPKKARTA